MTDVSDDYSVVIPAYNNQDTIVRALRSVTAQSNLPREIIVVDDGSTDRTSSVIARANVELVTLLRQNNKGPGSARNAGIETASSRWVAFLDADDVWHRNHVSTLNELSRSFPAAKLLASVNAESDADEAAEGQLINLLDHAGFAPFQTSAVIAERGLLLSLKGFETSFPGEDVDLWFRAAMVVPIAVSPIVTTKYIRTDTSVMGNARSARESFHKQSIFHSIDRAMISATKFRASQLRAYQARLYLTFFRQAISQHDKPLATSILLSMKQRRLSVPLKWQLALLSPSAFIKAAKFVKRGRSK